MRIQEEPIYKTKITKDTKEAIQEHSRLDDVIQIYMDGSGYKGGIGAVAVLLQEGQEPQTLHYHLGPNDKHTVHEAETLGLTLATQLLATE